jgi:hypothetical protein
MRSLSRWTIALFATPIGVVVLAALDSTLAICRLLRFGAEAALAVAHGERILSWLDSNLFHDIVSSVIVLALVLTVMSLVRIARTTRPAKRRRAA